MKKFYETPDAQIIWFFAEDVICNSNESEGWGEGELDEPGGQTSSVD